MSKHFINEVSRMKNLFDYKRGVVISEQTTNIFNPAAQFGIKGTKVEEYPECVRAFGNPTSNTEKTVYGIAGTGEYQGYYFYANTGDNLNPKGRVRKSDGTMGDYTCLNKKIEIYGNNSTAPAAAAAAAKQATKWTAEPATLDDDKNTLKKQMTGEKVKQLQTGLDIKGRGGKSLATGKFWTLTDAKLKELYPSEYTTQKGVTKTLFDKIVNPTLKASTAPAPTTIPAAGATPAGTTPATGAAPAAGDAPAPALKPIVAPTVAPTRPEAYFETLKKAGFIEGEGQNTVRFRAPRGQKTPNLSKEQQDLLTQHMNNMSYEFDRKGYDNRLVYRKK